MKKNESNGVRSGTPSAAESGARRGSRGPSRRGPNRRGTVLLMIVGVLALMAIIAVVYAAIAQADRRGAAAFAKANQIDDHVDLVRDYIAEVIGSARLDTYADRVPNAAASVRRLNRKAWDMPSVDGNMRTVFGQFAPPTGEVEAAFSTTGGAFTPWLSSIEPTRITTTVLIDPLKPYLNARDWFSITNICPDGRFVNLTNLRNNFRAEPGYGTDARGRLRMSERLTLFDQNGNVQPASGSVTLPDGSVASDFVPAHWTMRQIHAFRPIRDVDRRNTAPDPGTDEYYPNQWADADGDGIGDSRWFEMVRLDPTSPLNTPFIEALLPQDPSIRWFYAVKITDNSGRVNVNTATDQTAEPVYNASNPESAYKLGLSPADVDVRGLLSLSSVYNRYVEGGMGIGYNELLQPTDLGPTNYGRAADPYDREAARAIGQYGYGAQRVAIDTGVIPKPAPQQPAVVGQWDNLGGRVIGGLENRENYYAQVGSLPQGRFVGLTVGGNPVTGVQTRGVLGIDSELELRAFGSANDFTRRSDLEAIIDGRSDKAPFLMPWFGPLRSNRPWALERYGKGETNGWANEAAMLMAFADVRSRITTVSGGSPISSLTPGSVRQADPNEIVDEEVKVDLSRVLKLPRSATNQLNDQDRLDYIEHLVDALMPYRFDPNAPADVSRNSWGKRVSGPAWKKAVNYGGSAEFAYRSLLHLAVNTFDAIDSDNDTDPDIAGPTAISVKLTPGTITDTTNYPWLKVERPNAQLAQSNGDLDATEQVNIFGIEAQPFITEAVSYAMFTDLPPTRVTGESPSGQDDEWRDQTPFPPMPGDPFPEVTIRLDRSARNPDYIGEVIGFQITNPFDRAVRLDNGGTDGMLYYVEYAGNAYRLGQFTPPTGAGTGTFNETTLLPGQTQVFYCLSWPRAEMERRVLVAGSRNGTPSTTFSVNSFLDAQFGVGRHVQLTMIDPKLGTPTVPSNAEPAYGILDLHNIKTAPRLGNTTGAENFRPAFRDGVMIWRVMRPKNSATETAPINLTANDLLVDRLFDPITQPGVDGVKSLYINLENEGNEVGGSEAGDDAVAATARDNTGFSLIYWGSIRRPNLAPGDTLIAGTMPPWCIEARRRDQTYGGTIPGTLYNQEEVSDRTLGAVGEFGGSGNAVSKYRTIADMVSVLTSATTMALPQQIRNLPQMKTGNDIPVSQSNMLKYSLVAPEIVLSGNERGGKPRNAGLFTRAGDMLIPLAVGPHQEPALGTGAVNAFERLEREWMTLAEVLALSSDYYTPPPNTLYDRVCHEVTAPTIPIRRLDRGRLLLDEFVPFIDANNNGDFDYGSADRTLGLGIPLALNVLDRFRTNSWGSTTALTHGTINPNTAPIACLDATSPLMAPDSFPGLPSNSPWILANNPGATPPQTPLFNTAEGAWDVSTAVASYRDGVSLPVRPFGVTSTMQEVDFTGTNQGNMPGMYARRKNTFINGLREEPGFRSVGELLAVRMRNTGNGSALNRAQNHGVDRLGVVGVANGMLLPIQGYPGVTSTTTTFDVNNDGLIDQSEAGQYRPANLKRADSYDAKLAIANSLLASMNVRSDVFTCSFLVHGYMQGDVEGLSDQDPLVPSIARRFVMVVDRSNVVRRGDKPKIILFKEVPL